MVKQEDIYGRVVDARFSAIELQGTSFDDHYIGTTFSDKLGGATGADRLQGEDGNDTLNGGAGNDTLMEAQGTIRWMAVQVPTPLSSPARARNPRSRTTPTAQ